MRHGCALGAWEAVPKIELRGLGGLSGSETTQTTKTSKTAKMLHHIHAPWVRHRRMGGCSETRSAGPDPPRLAVFFLFGSGSSGLGFAFKT
jgi:hypothetical protein